MMLNNECEYSKNGNRCPDFYNCMNKGFSHKPLRMLNGGNGNIGNNNNNNNNNNFQNQGQNYQQNGSYTWDPMMVREYVKQNINNADGIFTTIVLRINKGDKMATYKGGRKDTGAVGLTTFNKLRYSP